jgi:NADP-dependent 3-hydroxy acid dehydrogenase YdfG
LSRILITGSSTGVGRATAIELAERGHDVIATARRPETLGDLPVAQRLALDVTDQASVDAALHAAGHVDALVSNAGETLVGTVEGTPLEEFDRMFQLNTLGALRVARAVLPQLRERDAGRLVFVSSIVGRIVRPLGSAYAQSKWALEAIAESLALELAETGVRVTLIEPGPLEGIGRSKAPSYPDDFSAYASLWERQRTQSRVDGVPLAEVARVIADAIEQDHPAFRIASDPATEGALRALDQSDRFAEPFDLAALKA